MMILDKKGSLHTLFNLGATTKEIKRIFFSSRKFNVCFRGNYWNNYRFCYCIASEKQFELVMITPSLPYPVTIEIMNIFLVLITITVLGLIASKIASGRISETLVRS